MLKELSQKFIQLFEHDITAEIKERVTNPFFVSLGISWLVWNWWLVFILFNFNESDTLDIKTQRLKTYLNDSDSCNLHVFPILSALFAVLVLGFMNQISLAISVFFRRRISPIIYKKVGYKDIVDSESHIQMKKKLYRLQEAYNELQTEQSDTSNSFVELKKQRDGASEEVLKLQNEIFELKSTSKKNTLDGLFTGTWVCDFVFPDGRSGSENIEIRDGNKYIRDGRYTFDIDMIEVTEKTIKYRKIDINDEQRTAIGNLNIIGENEYIGIEDKNTLISYRKHGSESLNLRVNQSFEPTEIQPPGKSRLIFNFKNNTSRDLEILSYEYFPIYNRKPHGDNRKLPLKKDVGASGAIRHEFELAEPLKKYFSGASNLGIYDLQIRVEYRYIGTTQLHLNTSFARLIVTDKIIVYKAIYGSGAKTKDVTQIIRDILMRNQFVIDVNNETMQGDPASGKQKTLVLDYSINGVQKQVSGIEQTKLKVD